MYRRFPQRGGYARRTFLFIYIELCIYYVYIEPVAPLAHLSGKHRTYLCHWRIWVVSRTYLPAPLAHLSGKQTYLPAPLAHLTFSVAPLAHLTFFAIFLVVGVGGTDRPTYDPTPHFLLILESKIFLLVLYMLHAIGKLQQTTTKLRWTTNNLPRLPST
jgi:hypothetical protein